MILVMFGSAATVATYRREHPLPITILRDPDRSAYRRFGLGRGAFSRVWGWRSARAYSSLLRSGGWRGLRRPRDDTRQLGGDFVIDGTGRLAWGHWGAGPDDRPAVATLVAAARAARPPAATDG
ncbi:MAG: AhpC/TSA family protein [Acidimicrobiales bacterium]